MGATVEKFFYSWGCAVASNPWKVILATIAVTGLCSIGLCNFRVESRAQRLWLPDQSKFSSRDEWKGEHFIEGVRGTITFLAHQTNVLTVEALLLLLDLHQRVDAVVHEGANYSQVCLKIPITNIMLGGRHRRRRAALEIKATSSEQNETEDYLTEDYFNFYETGIQYVDEYGDFSDSDEEMEGLPKDVYCDLVETLQDKCGEYSLLEIWKYDKDLISSLTDQDIIDAINTVQNSPIFGHETNYTNYLGQVEYNASGHVVKAKSIRSIWLEKFHPYDGQMDEELLGLSFENVDPFILGYEHEVLNILKSWNIEREEENNGYSLYMNLGLSFSEEYQRPMQDDVKKQIVGYSLMFLYTLFNLGKLSMVEGRFYLAAAGIISVFFGVTVGFALTMALGYPYTVGTAMLPFICLGIGIDDIFVIMRCFDNITAEEKKSNSIVQNIGITMKQAGATITVTSVTDICAFATGAMTSFPGLKSLCISATFGIAVIYLFQISWFIAWLVFDENRIEHKRNAVLPFIEHKDWEPMSWTQIDFMSKTMRYLSRLFKSNSFQAIIIILSIFMLSVGVWGVSEIRLGYPGWKILPKTSYFRAWLERRDIDFPSDGESVSFFMRDISYTAEDFERVEAMVNELNNLTTTRNEWLHYGRELPKSVQTPFEAATGFWWTDFKMFITNHKNYKDWREAIAEGIFAMYLSDFLHHEEGSIYNYNFRFSGNLTCGMGAPPITASKLGTLKLRDFQGLDQFLPAQNAIDDILLKANLSEKVISDSREYWAWEVMEILHHEIFRNLAITLAVVFLIIIFTLQNIRCCLFILACVVFTLLDIVGAMHLSGMILEPVNVCSLIISIGLSVDYGAHIAHAFMISKGTSNERAIQGFISISPAVVQGGISTFLAVTPLAFSQSLAFTLFFRMTSFTVLFGLFHGLLFLPVMLTLFGGDNVVMNEDPAGEVNTNTNQAFPKGLHSE